MWIFGNFWNDLASRQEIPWHLVKVCRCFRLDLPRLRHCVFLQHFSIMTTMTTTTIKFKLSIYNLVLALQVLTLNSQCLPSHIYISDCSVYLKDVLTEETKPNTTNASNKGIIWSKLTQNTWLIQNYTNTQKRNLNQHLLAWHIRGVLYELTVLPYDNSTERTTCIDTPKLLPSSIFGIMYVIHILIYTVIRQKTRFQNTS